jgi:tellurite methyltransferase
MSAARSLRPSLARVDDSVTGVHSRAAMAEEDRLHWDKRWAEERDRARSLPAWVAELDDEIPRTGRALDLAAGAGRVAVAMARRGLDVTAVDISPVGLALAREAARDEGLKLKTETADLERDGVPQGPWDLIACFHYRQPGLFSGIKNELASGGLVLAEVATIRTKERNPLRSVRWLAEQNELLRAAEGLELVYYREGFFGDRALARLAARRV